MSEFVAVGVPAYRGTEYVAETLRSIEQQTHRDLDVLISVDGADEETAAACAPFLKDSRFKMVVQPTQLGWVRNINWLMEKNQCPFWYYHQQDDLVDPSYVSTLLAHARANPRAAVTYCDIQCFGTKTPYIQQHSVLGSAAAREIALIVGHYRAVAFRGLVRQSALQQTRGVRENEVENFSSESVWMASIARAGELHRVPQALYRKRLHTNNVHIKWRRWSLQKRMKAWQVHCRDVFMEASQAEASLPDCRLMWAASVARLTSPIASGCIPVSTFDSSARQAMLEGLFSNLAPRDVAHVEATLDLVFDDIMTLSRAMLGVRRPSLLRRLASFFRREAPA